MPDSEQMFKYHGYSGPCPKPPMQKAKPAISTNAQMLKCAERELKMREHVYPRRVADKRMTQVQATLEIETMRAIVEHFEPLAAAERLI
jgi:hypothetical protein